LENVGEHPADIARIAADRFGITRQAVAKHLKKLVAEKILTESGKTRSRTYGLCPLEVWEKTYENTAGLAEDVVWTDNIAPVLGQLPDNVLGIWHYGFTEMFNNAIDHSESKEIQVRVERTATATEVVIFDSGVGIFRKIQAAMGLLDERHAIFELAKGKLTTDPKNHTGEGIFFSSRMFDEFSILSGGIYFGHVRASNEDWLIERTKAMNGTAVFMQLNNHTSRTTKKVFDQFAPEEDGSYGFTKTVVPVKLAIYGHDQLISRSQAKRLLARLELFKTIYLDFTDVAEIGQAFADEIFRVFATHHPDISLVHTHANDEVRRMISRAQHSNIDKGGA
jgi:hypothetical protein